MSAILLENLFIDHSNDLKPSEQIRPLITDLSHAIGEGIAKALSLSKKVLYKVIAGSFKDRQNAENRKNYLSSKGISSVIVEVKISGETWYRVQAGAFYSKAEAEARLKQVKDAGIGDAYILGSSRPTRFEPQMPPIQGRC